MVGPDDATRSPEEAARLTLPGSTGTPQHVPHPPEKPRSILTRNQEPTPRPRISTTFGEVSVSDGSDFTTPKSVAIGRASAPASLAREQVEASMSTVFGHSLHSKQKSGTKLRRTFSFFGNLPTADDGDGYPRHLVPPAHMIEGPNRAAWAAFKLLDVDKSGSLDDSEFIELAEKLHIKMGLKKLRKEFATMDTVGVGTIPYAVFAEWWNTKKEEERRVSRRHVKEIFDSYDKDGGGSLDKDEMARMVSKATKRLKVSDFDLEKDWKLMSKGPHGGVSFNAFESWWKERMGILDSDIPVLPEYMVQKIVESGRGRRACTSGVGHRKGGELWDILRPRLRMLVRMQTEWGAVNDLYDSSSANSLFTAQPVPPYIRDPDSSFSMSWDLVQVMMLLYVALLVPLRICFDVFISVGSISFWMDVFVDVYFITDLFLSFRVAYYEAGIRIDSPRKIAINYLKGWFLIDFVSCLPVSYIMMVIDAINGSGGAGGGGASTRSFKIIRLIRLSKMLRLARIKRILSKYQDNVDFATHLQVGFTIFGIFFAAHMLTCFWFMAGSSDQEYSDNVKVRGWVSQEDAWQIRTDPNSTVAEGTPSEWVSLSTKYITSMYYVFNAVENGYTDTEKLLALLATLVTGFIFGSMAALMAMISADSGNNPEASNNLRKLKSWMLAKRVPKVTAVRIMEFFNHLWNDSASVDVGDTLKLMPPSMRSDLTGFLYADFLQTIPMFRGLSREVISALCQKINPLKAIKGQTIIREGEPGREMYMLITGELEVRKKGPLVFRLTVEPDAKHPKSCETKVVIRPLGESYKDGVTVVAQMDGPRHSLEFSLDRDGCLMHVASGKYVVPDWHQVLVLSDSRASKENQPGGSVVEKLQRFSYDRDLLQLQHSSTGHYVHLQHHFPDPNSDDAMTRLVLHNPDPIMLAKEDTRTRDWTEETATAIILTPVTRDMDGDKLGYLSDGAFFGEMAVMDDSTQSGIRSRTVRAVTDSELCFIERAAIEELVEQYPELKAVLQRFTRIGSGLNKKGRKWKQMDRGEIEVLKKQLAHDKEEREEQKTVDEIVRKMRAWRARNSGMGSSVFENFGMGTPARPKITKLQAASQIQTCFRRRRRARMQATALAEEGNAADGSTAGGAAGAGAGIHQGTHHVVDGGALQEMLRTFMEESARQSATMSADIRSLGAELREVRTAMNAR